MTSTEAMTPDNPEILADLPYEALRRLVFDVLHGTAAIGAPLDPRLGIRPFERLSEVFHRADRVVRSRITEIIRQFLHELTDIALWPAEARWDLLDLVQDCGYGVVDDIHALIRQKTLYESPDVGPSGHAGLVKCLLSLGALSTPDWWFEQFGVLGADYGALIFAGLAEHGLDEAVNCLPAFCKSDHALQEMRLLIPGLVDQFGLDRMRETIAAQLPHLVETGAQVFAEDLGIPVTPPPGENQWTTVSRADIIADEVVLAGDKLTISDMERFREAVAAVLQGLVVAMDISEGRAEAWVSLVLGQTAKLAVFLAPLVSGEHAQIFLWRLCEKLLLIFAGLRLIPDHDYREMFWQTLSRVLERYGMADAADELKKCLRASSEPVPTAVRPSKHKTTDVPRRYPR